MKLVFPIDGATKVVKNAVYLDDESDPSYLAPSKKGK
jgi:hypothetical protein